LQGSGKIVEKLEHPFSRGKYVGVGEVSRITIDESGCISFVEFLGWPY
jgi:hypothetical protein